MAYLESKPRYEILDGLRGVGALIVVAFHLFERYSGGVFGQTINHGYLAVDFFFALSGFVIGYAYDDRWAKSKSKSESKFMSLSDFFKRRLVRLHPMLVAGGLLGLLTFYLSDGAEFPLINQTHWWQAVLLFLLSCTMLPAPESIDIRGWEEPYPLNSPQWSLLFEYAANILYACVLRRLPRAVIWLLLVFAAVGTIDLGLCLNLFGDKPAQIFTDGTFIGGWGVAGWQLHVGIVRLSFPFLSGLLIARCRRFISVRGGFWWCTLLIDVALSVPRIGGENFQLNGLYETLVVLLLFPLILAIGAGSRTTDEGSRKICRFLGDISYPIYITHYSLIYLQVSWGAAHEDLPLSTHIFVNVGLFFLSILLAYAMLKLFDEPVREWLKEHWLKNGKE